MPAVPSDSPTGIGLVLGGGGLTGTAFHAGLIAALADAAGWDARSADLVVGTSAGSTSAALLRAGLPPADFVARMLGGQPSAEGARVLSGLAPLAQPHRAQRPARRPAAPALLPAMVARPWRYRPGVLASALLPEGTLPINEGAAAIGLLFDGWPAEDTWICTVRLDDGARVVFGRDVSAPMREAVAASCAIPGYYSPVPIAGRRYVDGGMWSTHNLDLVAGLGLDLVIVSAPMSTADLLAPERGNLPRVPIRTALDRQVSAVRKSGTQVVVVAPDRELRAVMGTRSMRLSQRAPVAQATYDHVRELVAARRFAALAGS